MLPDFVLENKAGRRNDDDNDQGDDIDDEDVSKDTDSSVIYFILCDEFHLIKGH